MNNPDFGPNDLEKHFVVFLSEEKLLQDLERVAIDYKTTVVGFLEKEKFLPPLRFDFKLDLNKIKKISEKLYKLIVKEPLAALDLIKNVIYCALLLKIPTVQLEKTDVQVNPTVINLPVTADISMILLRPSCRLETTRGTLISKTSAVKYVRSAFFGCKTRLCSRSKWQRYFNPTSTSCPECYNQMREYEQSTDVGEEIFCHFASLEAYYTSGRFQALNVRIKDELCYATDLQIGEEYIITGRFYNKFFEVMNIQSPRPEPENFDDMPQTISDLIRETSQKRPGCPWSFVIALSAKLGAHILPASSFLNLKMGLMLVLATLESNVPVPLVAVGNDSLNAQNLFQSAGKFAQKYIRQSISQSFLGGTVKSVPQSDAIYQEAGQLILAAKGICNIGDWSKLKKEQTNYICQSIESGQVVFNKGEFGKSNVTNFVPLQCSIWTYWCNIKRNRTHTLQLKTLINVFGMPFLAEEKNERELQKICWNNMNAGRSQSENVTRSSQLLADVKEFYKIINSREVTLSESASQLIRAYFVASRRDRPECLPVRAIESITSLAEAHARLSMRDETSIDDVVAIVYLYEESMSTLYGESLTPFPRTPWNETEPIYVWMARQMALFKTWLEEYTLF